MQSPARPQGRPPLAPSERKASVVRARVSAQVMTAVRASAQRSGVSVSTFVRRAVQEATQKQST